MRITSSMALAVALCCSASAAERQQMLEHCSALIAQKNYRQGVACLQSFEKDAKPDAQTAMADYQLGQLYETGRAVPADPDHALRLYRMAEKLNTVAPDVAKQARTAATRMINRLRQSEEP